VSDEKPPPIDQELVAEFVLELLQPAATTA
jgi:hypothetical protein